MAKKSYRQLIAENLAAQDEGVNWYFLLLPELLDKISSPRPALAFCFQQIEYAQRCSIYALIMREYRTDSELTWKVVQDLQITRRSFPKLFSGISGKSLDISGRKLIEPAEEVRDAIMHGKDKSTSELHKAILACLQYVEHLNDDFYAKVGFRPVGKLQGVTSKKGSPQLSKKISRAILLGLTKEFDQNG